MKRLPIQPEHLAANDPDINALHLPDDWDAEGARAEAGAEEGETHGDDRAHDHDGDEEEAREAMLRAVLTRAPRELVAAQRALDSACDEAQIAAARALVRPSGF